MEEKDIRNLKVGDHVVLYDPITAEPRAFFEIEGVETDDGPEIRYCHELGKKMHWHPAVWCRQFGWVNHKWLLFMGVKVDDPEKFLEKHPEFKKSS